MKKIISVSLVLLTVLSLLAGCGNKNKSQAVLDLEEQIEAIPDEITPETGAALSAARAAYEALPEEEQPKMKALKRLEQLEADYLTFMDVKNFAADALMIKAGTYDKTTMFSNLVARADEIKKTYNKLPKDQQEQIEGIDVIDEVLPAVQTYIDNAKAGAANYLCAFFKLNENKNYNITAVYCSKQLGTDGEELHFYALTYQDEKSTEHTLYSNARFSHEVTPSILLTRPETFFSETAPSGDNNPVEYGNVTLDAAEITAEARKLPAPKMPSTTAAEKAEDAETKADSAEEAAPAAEATTVPASETNTAAPAAETTTAAAN